jgi:pimeloyl-ACP methyl ester carboxylesterase
MILSKKTRVLAKRIFWVFVPAVLVLGLGVVGLSLYLIHRLAHPQRTQLYGSPRDFQVILQKPMWSDEKWKNSDSTQSVGWFLSQNRPAPAIILSHSYESNRSDLLTLSFELWKAGYHVLVYDMRGHGESPVNWSGLGSYERDDLLSAIKYVKSLKSDSGQDLLDGRIGLYGAGLGGYVSLVASSQDPMVKAVAVDSVYPDIGYFINYRLKSYVGSESEWASRLVNSPWTVSLTKLAMQVYLLRREDSAPALEAVGVAAGRRLLFIAGKDAGPLQDTTRELFNQARDNKELAEVEVSRLDRLYDPHSTVYDGRVVVFFTEALPVATDKTASQLRASK